jgi:hypothetical protein
MSDDIISGGANQPQQRGEVPPDLFAVRITVSRDNFAELIEKFGLDVGCRPHVEVRPDGTGVLEAYASEERIRAIEATGYAVERGENVSALGRERQKEIGAGDRFQGGRIAPRGLGHKPGPKGGQPK